VKFGPPEIGKVVRYLSDKKQYFAWLSCSHYCAYRAQSLPGPAPQQCTQSAPDFIQIGLLLAELWPKA